MRYPIAIEIGTDRAFGVVFPDFPGCFSAGDSFEAALTNAKEALALHIDALDVGKSPVPSSIDKLVVQPQYAGFVWSVIEL